MQILKRIELEWKILALAAGLFVAFLWPVQNVFVNRLTMTLRQSVDKDLEPLLRSCIGQVGEVERSGLVASLERYRQWQALMPIIVREQRQIVFGFSLLLFFVLLLLALWTLKGLTRPLKRLAQTVEKIGRGERAEIVLQSGGALGTVEKAVGELQNELDVLRRQAQLKGMEKAWQDIARVMAHEIKNPLTPMRLSLDRLDEKLLEGKQVDCGDLRKFVDRINTQIDVLERLVDQFRSFSREPEASIRTVSLHTEIQALAGDMSSRIATTIDGEATVAADPYLLQQVLLNIWKNSSEAGATNIQVKVVDSGSTVQVHARDNGPGIEDENLDRVWLPYVSFKRGGTGLGLPVVKRLVETMSGTVRLESRTDGPQRGLCVILTFPKARQGVTDHG